MTSPKNAITPAERLELLLPLANGDALSEAELRQRLLGFLHGFDAPDVRLGRDAGMWDAHDASSAEVRATGHKLELLFRSGFWFSSSERKLPYWDPDDPGATSRRRAKRPHVEDSITWEDMQPPLSFPSLRFGAQHLGRLHKGWALRVDAGRLRDLVSFLALWLLTRGDIRAAQCVAPMPHAWDQQCGRFMVWTGRGRPPNACSKACAKRIKSKRKADRMKEALREAAELRKRARGVKKTLKENERKR